MPGDDGARAPFRHPLFPLVALLLLAATTLASPGLSPAAAAGPQRVRPHALQPGNAPPHSTALGALSGAHTVPLTFVLPPRNSGQVRQLLSSLTDPASPTFHQWLKPGQFAARYGPSSVSVRAVMSWLRGLGLRPTVSGFAVKVNATARRVGAALGVSFERYRTTSGHQGYLARQAPLVPASLAGGQISAVLGLNTVAHFVPELAPATSSDRLKGHVAQPADDGLTACPAAQSAAGSDFYTFDQLGSAYGIGSLLAAGQNGRGKTVALFELSSHSSSDVATYESCFGLNNPVTTVDVDGGGGPVSGDGSLEADIDIEQVATQAPDASIVSYEGGEDEAEDPAYDVWNAIVSADTAQVVSTSWGECEFDAAGDGTIGAYTTLFEQAAAQGQTIFSAAGDNGSEDCFAQRVHTTEQVDYPSSDPFITAVGGTSFFGPGDEVVWNDCQSSENLNCAENNPGAGGGGMSQYEPRPTNQPDAASWTTAEPCGTECREVPDLAANAGVGMIGYDGSDGGWTPVLGTSLAAPFLAGLVADTDVGCATSPGLYTSPLYSLYDQGSYGTAFTDITSGDNDFTGQNGGAFSATTGYDLATGVGSPLAAGLSCPEVTSIVTGAAGDLNVTGLGLEHATINFGSVAAHVVSESATQAVVAIPAVSGTVTVSATDAVGTGTQTASYTIAGSYVAVPPSRITDTRAGSGFPNAGDTVGPGGTLDVAVGGTGGVPSSGVSAVVLNVAATDVSAPSSFLTVYPQAAPRPNTANLLTSQGQTVSNLVTVGVGPSDGVSVYNLAGSVDVVVDVEGYYTTTVGSSGLYDPVSPVRVFGTSSGGSPIAAASTQAVSVTGASTGVPDDATAVVFNVTASTETSPGYLTAFPAGESLPTAANLTFGADQVVGNRVTVPVGTGGVVDIYNFAGTAQVDVDLDGYYTGSATETGSAFVALPAPTRLVDTRSSFGGTPLTAGATETVSFAASPAIADTAGALAANVTVVAGNAPGFLTIYPSTDASVPLAADVDWAAGALVPNFTIVPLDSLASNFFASAGDPVNVVVDAFGYFVPA